MAIKADYLEKSFKISTKSRLLNLKSSDKESLHVSSQSSQLCYNNI